MSKLPVKAPHNANSLPDPTLKHQGTELGTEHQAGAGVPHTPEKHGMAHTGKNKAKPFPKYNPSEVV